METILKTNESNAAMYNLQVSELFGRDAPWMFQDILRMLCIQFMIQAGAAFSEPSFPFWSAEFVTLLLYIVLGVMLYWLVVRKVLAGK